jgi:Predicted membrane protein
MPPIEQYRRAFFFLLAGGTGFLLYLAISNAMHYLWDVGEVASAVVATLLPILPTFFMQRRLTFRSVGLKRRSFPRYVMLQLGNAALIGTLTAVANGLGWPAAVAFLLAGGVGMFVSYALQVTLVFPDGRVLPRQPH